MTFICIWNVTGMSHSFSTHQAKAEKAQKCIGFTACARLEIVIFSLRAAAKRLRVRRIQRFRSSLGKL